MNTSGDPSGIGSSTDGGCVLRHRRRRGASAGGSLGVATEGREDNEPLVPTAEASTAKGSTSGLFVCDRIESGGGRELAWHTTSQTPSRGDAASKSAEDFSGVGMQVGSDVAGEVDDSGEPDDPSSVNSGRPDGRWFVRSKIFCVRSISY